MSLEFNNLPLVDVGIRIYFKKFVPLDMSLVSRAHGVLGERFPRFSNLDSIEATPVKLGDGPHITGIDGAKFEGNDRGVSVSLQPTHLTARWVRRFGPEARVYPRFANLEDDLWWTEQRLASALDDGLPSIAAVSMSYANFIKSGNDVRPEAMMARYFVPSAAIGLAVGAEILHEVSASWRSEGIDRRFVLKLTEAALDGVSERGYVVVTIAGAEVADVPAAERLRQIHGLLQEFFKGLLTPEARKEWGLVE